MFPDNARILGDQNKFIRPDATGSFTGNVLEWDILDQFVIDQAIMQCYACRLHACMRVDFKTV